jgi:hypothetical protein
MRAKILAVVAAVCAVLVTTTDAQAVKGGVPDSGEHPYVGELLFYDPTATDPRFTDPGAWFTCSGTLLDADTVVTAGHCTFPEGTDGRDDGHPGGTDVWISFAEAPNFSVLPPSSTFAPGNNAGRYAAWSAALNASSEWIRGTATPHPQYDDTAFFLHDVGVVQLSQPKAMSSYAQLPTVGLLDTLYKQNKQQLYTDVGYGVEGSGPKSTFGGDSRRKTDLRLVNLNGVGGIGGGVSAKFSSNAKTGGTCFGDSGGPIFIKGTPTLVAVNSYVKNVTCSGTSGGYRLDQPDDLAFLGNYV